MGPTPEDDRSYSVHRTGVTVLNPVAATSTLARPWRTSGGTPAYNSASTGTPSLALDRGDHRAASASASSQLEFATGQDSYLNSDSQIAIDNVEFQDDFGGEAIILLFRAEDGADITDLFAGDNLAELTRLEAELREVPEVYSVVAPLTSVGFSEAIVTEGVGTNALLSAVEREPDRGGARRSARPTSPPRSPGSARPASRT